MADTKTYISGHPIKLVDNKDGTFSLGVSGISLDIGDLDLDDFKAKDIPKYSWFVGGTPPTPVEEFAWGMEFNKNTGKLTVYCWTGDNWVGVE